MSRLIALCESVILLVLGGCDLAYPEIAVVNRTNAHTLIKSVSFNGCIWDQVLALDEATSASRCLPGGDRIHFKKFDVAAYCLEQAEDGTLSGVCACEPEAATSADDAANFGLVNEEPNWFNYQTISVKRVDYGDFQLFEITEDDIEQDFSVPGPYGH